MRLEPPPMRPVLRALPRSLNPKPHHTTSDWNFLTASWLLDTDYFVSSPASLQFTALGNYALLKNSLSGVVSEGRIITWLRFYRSRGIGAGVTFVFRCGTSDGAATLTNAYNLYFRGSAAVADADLDKAYFRYFYGGVSTDIENKTISPTLAQNTWHKLRFTWWVSAGVLMVSIEYWDGSAWTSLCPDFSDPNNRYATAAIQRCGVGTVAQYTFVGTWHDDTEVYKRV